VVGWRQESEWGGESERAAAAKEVFGVFRACVGRALHDAKDHKAGSDAAAVAAAVAAAEASAAAAEAAAAAAAEAAAGGGKAVAKAAAARAATKAKAQAEADAKAAAAATASVGAAAADGGQPADEGAGGGSLEGGSMDLAEVLLEEAEFPLFLTYLLVYAAMLDAFCCVASFGAGAGGNASQPPKKMAGGGVGGYGGSKWKVVEEGWKEGYQKLAGHGFLALSGMDTDEKAVLVLGEMAAPRPSSSSPDDSPPPAPPILLDDWCW
jgi:hypothetical protein